MNYLYTVLISFLSLGLSAQVISTDLNIYVDDSDWINDLIPEWHLDINDDGQDDFTLQFVNIGNIYHAIVGSHVDNEIVHPGYLDVTVFESGESIGPGSTGWNTTPDVDSYGRFTDSRLAYQFWPGPPTDPCCSGNFYGLTNKYIGVRFFDGGNTYYGYIEVSCVIYPEPGYFEIGSMGYNTVPDMPIEAGAEGDGSITYFRDEDGDDYGDPNVTISDITQPAGYVLDNSDCDDSDPNVNPGEEEIPYNGKDDDCDPMTLDDDLDEDGYPLDDDCDDDNPNVNPGEDEIPYNGLDDDCDLDTPDDDLDEDGWELEDDCDDTNPDVSPSEDEIPYNGIDDDCDEDTLDDDLDEDGYLVNEDCDDTNPDINPGEDEIPYNGIDDDCNTETLDDDLDEDGFGVDEDCDDMNAAVNPGQTEEPYNGVDDDCDPETLDDDLDGDGYNWAEDCDDMNMTVNPGQTEEPYNGVDDDCNPETLDDDLDGDGYAINEDCDDMNIAINPGQLEEPYNGIDDDCNPETLDDDLDGDGYGIDEDCDDMFAGINPGQTEEAYNGIDDDCDPATLDDDLDEDGFVLADDCDDTNASINPDAEDIPNNGIDENCDGEDAITAVHDLGDDRISIYPNPVSHRLYVDTDSQLNLEIQLFNLQGSRLLQGEHNQYFDVSNLPEGIYLLEVYEPISESRILEKVVISK